MSLPISQKTCDDGDFTILDFASGMRSAYVLDVKLQSQLSIAYLQDQSISIYCPEYFALIICWCLYVIKMQTRSSRVLFMLFYYRAILLILFVMLFIIWFCCFMTVSCARTIAFVCSFVSMQGCRRSLTILSTCGCKTKQCPLLKCPPDNILQRLRYEIVSGTMKWCPRVIVSVRVMVRHNSVLC